MIVVIALAVTRSWKSRPHTNSLPLLLGCILVVIPVAFSFYLPATIEWWIEFLLLLFFIGALRSLHVTRKELVFWTVLSIVPHACLGLWQFTHQIVDGTKWLGISAQQPLTAGVSVLPVFGQRILRAYGGFPHPNIFGGWLAFGLVMSMWLIDQAISRYQRWTLLVCTVLFSVALILTFSRSAWLACFVSLAILTFFLLQQSWKERRWRWGLTALLCISVVTGITVFQQRSLIFTRFDTAAPSEVRSVSERKQALQDGLRLFKQHPLVGVGPGATAYALDAQTIPHTVPLLMLDELGIIGVVGLLLGLVSLFLKEGIRKLLRNQIAIFAFALLFCLSLFDHYPWSLWSGHSLVALVILFLVLVDDGSSHLPFPRSSV